MQLVFRRTVSSPISLETWVRSACWIPGSQTINATMGPVAAGPGEGKDSDDTHVRTARYQVSRRSVCDRIKVFTGGGGAVLLDFLVPAF